MLRILYYQIYLHDLVQCIIVFVHANSVSMAPFLNTYIVVFLLLFLRRPKVGPTGCAAQSIIRNIEHITISST